MKTLTRLWALLLIAGYVSTLALPAVALAAVPTCAITITPNVVVAGGSATLEWTSTDANSNGNSIIPTNGTVNLDNVGPSGNKQIAPPLDQITTYIGTFTGPGGTANCAASVQVTYDTTGGSGGTTGGTTNGTGILGGTSGGAIGGTVGSGGGSSGSSGPLVQCGVGPGIVNSTSCQACNLAQLVQNLINFAIGLSIPIAVVLFAWAGALYFTSGANPEHVNDAKKILNNALIGFLIAITGWLVINTLLHALLDAGPIKQGSWFTIQCDTLNRPVNEDINTVLNSILPAVNTQALTSVSSITTTGGGPTCSTGFTYSASVGSCSSNTEPGFALPNGYSCPTGSTFAASATNPAAGSCVNDLDPTLAYPPQPVSGTLVGASETVTVTLTSGETKTFSCASCAPIPSDIPMKTATAVCSTQVDGTCQADTGLINSLETLKSNLNGVNWYVSEAWPPTVMHQSNDQNTGASIDISACNANNGSTDAAAVGACVQTFQGAASQSNLRAVYEVPTQAQKDNILATNSSLNVVAVPGITGPHFSIYKQ